MPSVENKHPRQGHFEREAKIIAAVFIGLPVLAILVSIVVFALFRMGTSASVS